MRSGRDRLSAVATAGLAVATLAGCGAATSTATPPVRDPGTSAEALGTAASRPRARRAASSPVLYRHCRFLHRDRLRGLVGGWTAARLSRSGRLGRWPTLGVARPRLSGHRTIRVGTDLDLSRRDPAPEVTERRPRRTAGEKPQRRLGGDVDGSDKAGEVVATSRVHSAEGRDRVITYVSGRSSPASLVVSFAGRRASCGDCGRGYHRPGGRPAKFQLSRRARRRPTPGPTRLDQPRPHRPSSAWTTRPARRCRRRRTRPRSTPRRATTTPGRGVGKCSGGTSYLWTYANNWLSSPR